MNAMISAIQSPRLSETTIGITESTIAAMISRRVRRRRTAASAANTNGASTPTHEPHWFVYPKKVLGRPTTAPRPRNFLSAKPMCTNAFAVGSCRNELGRTRSNGVVNDALGKTTPSIPPRIKMTHRPPRM